MKRAILIDGNNLMFRSYYATAYTGNIMKNSKGFPTNALFGFTNMINKILNEEKPEYIMVAFDIGKNFRHEKYKNYKAGRVETPKDLIIQFPIAKQLLTQMGIVYVEKENYEADDIIGTFAKMADEDALYDATIISSDKDLLQLISTDVNVKLLKQKDYILMNSSSFKEHFCGLDPIKIIDIKALQGDPSDNIPGVKGIGEKTALNLLTTYGTLENIYENIDDIKGKVKEKLILDKENAFFSKDLATIYKDVALNMTFEDIKIKEKDSVNLNKLYEELEFYSLIKKLEIKKDNNLEISKNLNISSDFAFYLELDEENYHKASIIGMGIFDGKNSYFLTEEEIIRNKEIFKYAKYTYDLKKSIVVLNRLNITLNEVNYDTMISAYLLNYNIKEDIAYLSNPLGYDIAFFESMIGKKKTLTPEEINKNICLKAKFIYETREKYLNELKNENIIELHNNIEFPLIRVLADMEIEGIRINKDTLNELREETLVKIERITNDIYNYAGCSFNISSPKQLGEILFDKLRLPYPKKKKGNYTTNHDILIKLKGLHPIINSILEYRNLTKLYNTYLDSLSSYILSDGKIHTIYKQTITRTGRLSSVEPNLQNIPIRTDEGRQIRKAFIPENDSVIMTSDYSQIELRLLAHISKCEDLINAFKHHEDIHTKVASDIFNVPVEGVTKNMRRSAKAVIFGIVYGISGYGLGENLDINPKEAKKLINKYLEMYPGVKKHMEDIKKEAYQNGYVTTIMNRKRIIDELTNNNYMVRALGERIALNTPIQGSSADIIKKSMIEINEALKQNKLKTKMILQVHDELVFNCYNNELEIVKKLVTQIMENTYKLVVPLKTEVDFGKNWYEAK